MTLENFGLQFHHFGLAVSDTERVIVVLKGMGYDVGEPVHDPLQEVILVWCDHEQMPAVELVAQSDKPGPLDNILSHHSELIYHLCYTSADIAASLTAMNDDGIRTITVSPPKPAVLFGGKNVGFYQLRGFGLIEIVEED